MDDERRELTRRLFTALTVQAERVAEIGVEGQTPTLEAGIVLTLANDAITITQLMSVISDAIYVLVTDPA